jgi:hypothetical protein
MPWGCPRRAGADEDDESPDEQDALLPSTATPAESYTDFPEAADETRLLQQSNFVNVNSGWYLFLSNLAFCAVTLISVSGAYFFVLHSYKDVVPHCYEYQPLHEGLCNVSVFCFWTYPIICPMVIVLLVYKNFLETRLYYECLLNRILLDYEEATFNHPSVYLILIWGLGAFTMLHYMDSDMPVHKIAFSMLAYFAPIVTFLIVMFSKWHIQAFLIPLPAFVSTDPSLAGDVLRDSSRNYVFERQMRVAFENVNDQLMAQEAQGNEMAWDTKSFFGLLREAAHVEINAVGQSSKHENGLGARTLQKILGWVGIKDRPQYSRSFDKVTRPEVLTCWFTLRNGSWVNRLLWSPFLLDDRALNFRWWARLYVFFIIISFLIFVCSMSCTIATFLVHQQLADPSSPWVKYLNVGEGFGADTAR